MFRRFQDSLSSSTPVNHFRIACFGFFIKTIDPLSLPEYKGAVLRGGFGYAFRKVVCALRNKTCPDCLLREKCVFAYVFETPPPSDTRIMRKYPTVPHPFILLPPLEDDRIYEPGEKLNFHLTLVGKAIEYLPYFIYAFEELGRMGLGKGRGKFSLENVAWKAGIFDGTNDFKRIYFGNTKVLHTEFRPIPFESPPPPSLGESFELHLLFATPTRLKYRGELTSDLAFHILFRNLLRRISLLSYFHCGKELEADYRHLIHMSEQVEILESNLHWHDWERFSTRQRGRMKLGGFMGRVSYSGVKADHWPFLALGKIIHVGKGTSFGLGKYEIL
jgi:hypothetical protein